MSSPIFVIGNGPSLADTPLGKLHGERCFATNKIHLIYPRTSWRPTDYFLIDWTPGTAWDEWLEYNRASNLWLWDGFRACADGRSLPGWVGNLANWVPRCGHEAYQWGNKPQNATSWHLPQLCTAYNTIGVMIQAAVMEDASEIILIGCDGYSGGEGPYFSPQYHEAGAKYDLTALWAAHSVAAHSSPIPIFCAPPSIFAPMYRGFSL